MMTLKGTCERSIELAENTERCMLVLTKIDAQVNRRADCESAFVYNCGKATLQGELSQQWRVDLKMALNSPDQGEGKLKKYINSNTGKAI